MKNFKLLVIPALLVSLNSMGQTSDKGSVGKTINRIGNKTAQLAVKGTSAVADKKYDEKVGPQGQTIYINGKSKYYYVNARGKKIYISKARLKDKPEKM